jgi:hypothetical protein
MKRMAPAGWRGCFLLIMVGALPLTGCVATQSASPTPEVPVSEAPTAPALTPEQTAPATVPIIAPTAPPTPALPLRPTATPAPLTLTLQILSALNGAGVETGAVRVMGITSGTLVNINGLPLRVSSSGVFQHDLSLEGGVNLIEVTAANPSGQTTSQQLAVFFISSTAGLPFTLLYPSDGLQVAEPTVSIVGVTWPDAVVGVNETPVEVNARGIFSTTMELDEGSNLIEVVAADLQGNVRFQTLAVFYSP